MKIKMSRAARFMGDLVPAPGPGSPTIDNSSSDSSNGFDWSSFLNNIASGFNNLTKKNSPTTTAPAPASNATMWIVGGSAIAIGALFLMKRKR